MIHFFHPMRWLVIVGLLFATSLQAYAQSTTIQVNSLGDAPKSSNADSGSCWTGDFVGDSPPFAQECTLRAAIQAANERSSRVNIEFTNVPFASNNFSLIQIGSALPTIHQRVELRGQTHPMWTGGRPKVLISAPAGVASYSGVTFGEGSDHSSIENIGIGRLNDALTIENASNLTIQGNSLAGIITSASFTIRNGRDGLRLINSSQNIIRGNSFRGNERYGVFIGTGSGENILFDNNFGVRPNSGLPDPLLEPSEDSTNETGVFVAASANAGNQIGSLGGNYFANQTASAMRIFADGQLVTNNRIGLPPENGTAPGFFPEDYALHGESAILLGSNDNQVGTSANTGNAIGGGDQIGIVVGRTGTAPISADDNEIVGNRIGLDADGEPFGLNVGIQIRNGNGSVVRRNRIANCGQAIRALTNSSDTDLFANTLLDNEDGIRMSGSGTIGGTSLATGNVIGGNARGILLVNSNDPITIRNNYVGTDADGNDLGNSTGISVQGNEATVAIGLPGQGNIIGNSESSGILLTSSASEVTAEGNWIGRHPDGTAIGNLYGIRIAGVTSGASDNQIGFAANESISTENWPNALGSGNVIAHNARGVDAGSADDDSVRNTIRGNVFLDNSGRDINLGMDAIDPGGGNSGPNTQLNWPEIQSGSSALNPQTGKGEIELRVQTLPDNASYPLLVDLYLVDPDSMMPRLLTTIDYVYNVGFSTVSFSWPRGVPMGGQLVATTTDQPGGPYANTSQFTAQPVTVGTGPGTLSTATQNNGSGGVFLDVEATGSPLEITGFDLPTAEFDGNSTVEISVFLRDGSYVGNTDDADGWQLHETLTYETVDLDDTPTALSSATLDEVIELLPGDVTGVYLQTMGNGGLRYHGTNDNPPQTTWSNQDLALFSDTATTANQPFSGNLFSPRAFSGIVRYEISTQEDPIFQDRFE